VYENCFGPEVVKEVRKEMKIATAKCNGNMPMSVPTPSIGSLKVAMASNNGHEFSNTLHQQQQQQHEHHGKPTHEESSASFSKTQPSIDINKLQQAILAGYNKHLVSNFKFSEKLKTKALLWILILVKPIHSLLSSDYFYEICILYSVYLHVNNLRA